MRSESSDSTQDTETGTGVKRRGLLRFGSLLAALTGGSAISILSEKKAHAGPGDKAPSTGYVPIAEKGVASGVATLDRESRIPPAQLPDLSATIREAGDARYPKTTPALTRAEYAAKDAKVDVAQRFAPIGATTQKYRGGGYYWLGDATSGSSGDVGANNMRLFPFFIPGPSRINVGSLFLEVSVAGSSESTFTLAIYSEDGFGVPKNLVVKSGPVASSTAGVKEVPMVTTLNPGLYFYAVYVPTASVAPQFTQVGSGMRVSLGSPILPSAADRSSGFVIANIADTPPASISTWPSTSITCPCVGMKVTSLNPFGSSAFDADFGSKGLTAYETVVHPERVALVNDPLGSGRMVAKFSPLDTDTGPTSAPRAQLDPYQNIRDGDRVWFGFSLLLPVDFPVIPPGGWVNFAEIYGSPYGGASPTKIYIDGSTGDFIGWRRSATYGDDMPWKMPVVRNRWMDFAIQARMSEDESAGFFEVWVNTGNGWQQQFLNEKLRLYTKTRDYTNNKGNSNAAIKLYRKPGMFAQLTCYFGSHKVGDTFESVDPHTYS
ncbi:heparin lyase I family protein [Arthrobacter sp. BE255]|uniref:heparin lyase I family protein n=1 Tax=Arthrobacter sp. BE255 TaxID=2817721 RepID=UPI00285F328A|nr:heparin lyase I family protein [Arthrobacter sp. BE255]MDR7160121.1 hypothetical protein [Arthrobacter sp. BE255]